MSVRDLSLGRRSVIIDGRRFVIRKMTVEAVVSVLELFPREVRLAWKAYQLMPATWARDPVGSTVHALGTAADPRWVEILQGFVEGWEEEKVENYPTAKVIDRVAKLSDLKRIAEALKFDEMFNDEVQEEYDVLPLERDIVDLAEKFGLAPHDIMAWPFEEYLRTIEVIIDDPKNPKGAGLGMNLVTPGAASSVGWITPDDGRLPS